MKLETDSSFVATEIHNTRNFVAPAVIDMGNFQAVIGEVHGRCRIGQRAIQHRADRSRVGNVEVDFLLQVAAPSTAALDDVLDQVGEMTGVKGSESLIHLSTKLDRAM